MRYGGGRRRRMLLQHFLVLCAIVTGVGLLMLALRPIDPPIQVDFPGESEVGDSNSFDDDVDVDVDVGSGESIGDKRCATVEEMGKDFENGVVVKETLRVRRIIEDHFDINGASRVRKLPSEQFCRHGFVLGKTAEAGFGNEMYKLLSAAALSIMLNRSLIIGQTRHIETNILLGIIFHIPTLPLP